MASDNSKFDVAKYFDNVVKTSIESNTNSFIDNCFKLHPFDNKAVSASAEEIDRLAKEIHQKSKHGWNSPWVVVAVVLLFICGIIPGIILLVFMIKNRKKLNAEVKTLDTKRDDLISKNMRILKPVCDEITTRSTFDLMEKAYPSLKLHDSITDDDFNDFAPFYLVNQKNVATYSNLHGEVQNHPFLLLTQKRVDMVPKVYTGSTTVTVHTTDSDGHPRTETRVVTASITKPFPQFSLPTELVFKSNSMSDLTCSNEAPLKNEKAVKKFYKKYPKQRNMENPEFDRLYPFIRNNEIQFRALFTIFTQEEMVRNAEHFKLNNLQFWKEKGPYFEISSNNGLNSQKMNFSGYTYLDYNPETIRKSYLDNVNNTLNSLYQFLTPILSCSLLQQERYFTKGKKTTNNFKLAQFENHFNTNFDVIRYLHPSTSSLAYNGISKFVPLKKGKNYQLNRLVTNSYSSKSLIEYVNVFAYGQSVNVPVRYDQFYPEQASYLTLSWKNKNIHDFVTHDIPKELSQYGLNGISQSGNEVMVTFKPSLRRLNASEEAIINTVNNYLK